MSQITEIRLGEFSPEKEVQGNAVDVGFSEKLSYLMGGGFEYDGVTITLDDGTVYQFGIYNKASCCESWGFLSPPDAVTAFVGAEFVSLDKVGTNELQERADAEYLNDGGVAFVNVETSLGQLQFAAYNAHNGYYGHSVSAWKDGALLWGEVI